MGVMNLFKHLFADDWGVHPDDHKLPAADVPLRVLPLPERLYVPMQQHVGGPARPVVLVGQRVRKGELIAEAQGKVSAPVHAPTSGEVSAIGEITAPHPSGLAQLAITIAADGADAGRPGRVWRGGGCGGAGVPGGAGGSGGGGVALGGPAGHLSVGE